MSDRVWANLCAPFEGEYWINTIGLDKKLELEIGPPPQLNKAPVPVIIRPDI